MSSPNLEKEFFKFVYERQLIWYKRFVLREDAPWSDDEVLRTYKIINVYRELDKCTQYILNKFKGIGNREKLLVNVIFYRFFNQFGLYETLGIEPFDEIDGRLGERLIGKLSEIQDGGVAIFNNAYLISSGRMGVRKHVSVIEYLVELDIGGIVGKIDSAKSPREALEVLEEIPMVGPFLACEMWTDLSYFGFFRQGWTDDDFVNIGPGSKWGLEIMYGGKLNKKEQEEKLWRLRDIQKDFLKRDWKRIAYEDAFSNYPFLSITNIEGALCEFRKYWRIRGGEGRRKYFSPCSRTALP